MSGFCRSCSNWTPSVALKSIGRCSKKKDMVSSLNSCSYFEPKPVSFLGKVKSSLGFFWGQTGGPVWDGATSSRKTLEMMFLITFMAIAFAVMMFKVFPGLSQAMFGAFSGPSGASDSGSSNSDEE